MPTVSAERLMDIAKTLLQAAGASVEEAATIARYNIGANLVGHDSHGIILIPTYIDRIKVGHIVPGAPWNITQETPTTTVIDGNWGFGYVVTDRAMRYTIDKAKKQKVAAATVFRQSHIGRLASYPLMAAREGMIAMITADSGRSAKAVAPFGGAKARLGTNPICFAIPSNLEGPLFFDMATSAAAAGKINVATARGEQVPAGWLIDADGKPSTDPRVLRQGGALLPVGGTEGYKGYGLATIVEILLGPADRPWLRRRTDGPAQRRLLHRRVQRRRVPRSEYVQAGGYRIRAVPEGDAAGTGLHRGAVPRRDRIQARAGSAQERHSGGGRHLEKAPGPGAGLRPR